MRQGYAYIAGAMSNDFVLQAFGGGQMAGGYIADEVRRLMKEKPNG